MNIGKVTFSAQDGCLVEIDGWLADIETKTSMLAQGVCHVRAVEAAHSPEAEDLLYSPCGQDGTVFGCPDPVLVELAIRYNAWIDGVTDFKAAAPQSVASQSDAVAAIQMWLINRPQA